MRRARNWFGAMLGATILAAGAGCGGAGTRAIDRSTAQVKVTGTIKINGALMKGGTVTFTPSMAGREGAGSVSADVKADGKYELTTLVGRNDVRIGGPALKKEPALGYSTKNVDVPADGGTIDVEFP